MKISLFDFILPVGKIASQPAFPRDSARMLVVGDSFQDKKVANLIEFLRPGDVMVFNNSKVIPARLSGMRGNAKIEILLHKKMPEENWQCFAKPAKRLRLGDIITFSDDFSATVMQKYEDGQVLLNFDYADEVFQKKLECYGVMPLPPYIEKSRRQPANHEMVAQDLNKSGKDPALRNPQDDINYQTIYAENAGSVAAPTAGLHFTRELLAEIKAAGVKIVYVTLHIGGGTFLPVKADNTENHVMHSEYAVVTEEVAQAVNAAKQAGGRVFAVGTTSVRTLESATDGQGILREFAGETNIFITPGYRFRIVDAMLTNFHLPKSTLFILVCAFSGLAKMREAYTHAIRENYRFYSYGDACLLFAGQKE